MCNRRKIELNINRELDSYEYRDILQGRDTIIYLILFAIEVYCMEKKLDYQSKLDLINKTNIINFLEEDYEYLHVHGIPTIISEINKNIRKWKD